MPNVGLTVNVGVAAGNLPFQLPSKRNIGFAIESQRGVPGIVYPAIGSLSDYVAAFGGAYNGQFSYYLIKSLFDNAVTPNGAPVPVTLYAFRVVGSSSVAATAEETVQGSIIAVTAGYQGQEDPGDWGNSLQVIFYTYSLLVRNQFVAQVYYQGQLVETWQGTTCASLQAQINKASGYITITFSAEVPQVTLSADLTGTITAATSSAIVTGASSAFLTDLAVGNVIYDTVGNVLGTVQSIQSNTSLTLTGLASEVLTASQYKKREDIAETIIPIDGVYDAPTEEQFYPVPSPTDPQGLSIFDGQDVQLICVSENHTLTMAQQQSEYCAGRGDAMAVVNLPLNSTEGMVQNYANTLQATQRAFICGYLEWVQVLDSTGAAITIPSLGAVLGAGFLTSPYVQGDYIHIPPAGTDGPYVNVQAVVTGLLSISDVTKYVQQYTVNVSTFSKLYGRYLIGSRAYSVSILWCSIHTNLQASYYARTFLDNLAFAVQKSNQPSLKKRVIGSIDNFMRGEYDNGSLEQAVSYDDNVDIISDQSNNPLNQDRKILNVEIDYIPPEATESVVIQLNRNDAVLQATITQTNNN